MKTRWKVWVAGIALAQLLVIGVDVALLWPSEAKVAAERVRPGMSELEVSSSFDGRIYRQCVEALGYKAFLYQFADRSCLCVGMNWAETVDGEHIFRVTSVRNSPPPPVHPLTRLRRTLARALPFLGE
jgi:hypothetical protein